MISRLFFNRRFALVALIFSIGMLFVALSPATEAAPPTPDKDDSKYQLEPADAELVNKNTAESGLYIVQLHDAPLASYRGGIEGLAATNPAAKGEKKLDVKAPESVAYLQYLDQQRAAAITEVSQALGRQLSVAYEYKASLNGFAAEMTPAEAAIVAKLPTIKHIEADTVEELHTDAGPAWIGAAAIWGEDPNTEHFESQLSGANEVPPAQTDASGVGTLSLNIQTGELDYTVEVSDIVSITMAHIHSGTAEVNGPVLHTLYDGTGDFDPDNPISGTVTLSPDEVQQLRDGGLYINVHTSTFGGGELRDQIRRSRFVKTIAFGTQLSGLNEVPPVTDTLASGVGRFGYHIQTGELDYLIEVSDIMSITAAHIHSGTAGTNGGVIHTLYNGTGNFPISGTVTLSDDQQAALWNGGLYVNVHTEDNPGGELRDQIEQVGTFGEGIIVGIIDTGIDPWNPSFLDVGDDGYDHSNPWGDGNYAGVCDPNDPTYDDTFPCNDKLIGAWGYATVNGGDPRDSNGHGSHTGSTTAGNVVFEPTVETPSRTFTATMISGVAPHANVIAYAACCTGSALTAARDQVVLDEVDVVNYSIGSTGPTGNPWGDAEEVQWLNIRDAGIFVATSAGNAGPGDETVGSPGDVPWMTTVGANSHNRAFLNSVTLDDGTNPPITLDGLGMTGGLDTPTEVVFAADYVIPPATAEDARLCAADAFPADTFTGQIVICERGIYGRVAKGESVAAGGAGGYILAQPDEFGGGPGSVAADPHVIPGVHIDYYSYQDLLAYFDNAPGAVEGTISGATLDVDNAHADVMASFSSRGANRALADIIVPSVTAPGRSIWAAYHQGEGGDGDFTFNVIQGTSMASPHVAGAGALMMASRPDWTPAEIESALMTTARHPILNDDGVNPATPFAEGAGEVDLRQAPHAGLVLDVTTQEFLDAEPAAGGDPKALNRASLGNSQCLVSCSWTRTVRSTLGMTVTWNATVMAAPGVTLTGSVEPASFELAPGATQELTIEVDVSGLPAGEWAFGELDLTPMAPPLRGGGGMPPIPQAHMPIAVQPSIGVLPTEIEINTRRNAGSQLVEGIQAIEITDLTVDAIGLSQGTLTHEMLDQDSDNTDPYDDLTDGVFFITMDVPADSYSLIAETTESSAPDMDLFVGLDSNGDGMPEAGEQLCSSTTGTAIEYCELAAPAAGTYWILVQNWDASASPPDSVTLVSAVVPNSDNGNMTVAGPDSVPAGEFFDLRLFWDTPEMVAGDRWYGYVSLGSAPENAGNIGTIPVYLNRHEDDVTKEVSDALVEAGDMVTYTITVQANVTAEELTYSLTDTIPAGMTYVADSASATEGTVDVIGDVLTWNGTLAGANAFTYAVSTSDDDAACVAPLATDGAYVDLEFYGLTTNSNIAGNDVVFTSDFNGGAHSFFGQYQGENVHYTDDGFAFFDPSTAGATPGTNQAIPTAGDPDNLMAIFWRDLTIVYDAGTNRGVTTANLTNSGVPTGAVIEYDDVEDADGGTYDFEVIMRYEPSDAWYEYTFAYDNLTGDVGVGTIGLENANGTLGLQYAYDDIAVTDGMAVCFDQVPLVPAPVVITFQAMADEDAPNEVTNTVDHNTDNPGSLEASASATTSVISYGVDVSPDMTATGDAGTTVEYTLSVTNTGNTTDTFDLTVDNNWTTTLSESSVTLLAGESTTVMASVVIPTDATDGESDTATVTATSQSSGAATDVATLTTTAVIPTSISLANFGQDASLAWQPIALLALLLVLMVGGGAALLQKRRTV